MQWNWPPFYYAIARLRHCITVLFGHNLSPKVCKMFLPLICLYPYSSIVNTFNFLAIYCSMVVSHNHKSYELMLSFFSVCLTKIRKYEQSKASFQKGKWPLLKKACIICPGISHCAYIFREDEYKNTWILLLAWRKVKSI